MQFFQLRSECIKLFRINESVIVIIALTMLDINNKKNCFLSVENIT